MTGTEKETKAWREFGDIRVFSPFVSADELEWHVDFENRIIEVIECGGWKFQRDEELPKSLFDGEVIKIPSFTWHRILKGKSNLVIRVTKLD